MRTPLFNLNSLRLALTFLVGSFLSTIVHAQQNVITTVVGTGMWGYTGDGGPAKAARLRFPVSVDMDAAGNLFIADYELNVIRKVSIDGIITTVAGNGTYGYSGDGGPATAAQMAAIAAVVTDNAGNLYISEQGNNVVRKVDAAGIITTVAGTATPGFSGDGGPASAAVLNNPGGLALDDAGNLYIADEYNYVIRKMSTAGIITTIAGIPGSGGYTGNGGPATAAKLGHVFVVCTDHSGNLYFSEGNMQHTIRKVNALGIVSLVAGDDSAAAYSGGEAPATAVQLGAPQNGLTVDDSGNVYASIGANILKINTAGMLSTFAGNGHGGFGGDGGDPLFATINPYGICFGNSGELYVAGSSRVRRIAPKSVLDITAKELPRITVFPNPCKDRLNISGLYGAVDIWLLNITGQIVLSQQYGDASVQPISIALPSMLPAGTYILRATSDNIATNTVITIER